jgi:hypothetical protein
MLMIRNRSYGAAVATSPLDVSSSAEDDDIDPLDSARTNRSHSNNNRRKRGTTARTVLAFFYHHAQTAGFKWRLLIGLVVAIVLVVVHESFYYLALNILVRRLPGPPYFGRPSLSSSRTTTDASKGSEMAIVSLHKGGGYKFAGYLGTWLDGNKAQYAARYGYRYFNQDDFRNVMLSDYPSPTWQVLSDYNDDPLVKQLEKLRFLLSIFQRYNDTELRYVLWLDGDAVIANPSIALEDRVTELEHQWWQRQVSGKINTNDNQMLFAWTSDGSRQDTGVILLRNCAATRALMAAALQDTARHTTPRATHDEVFFADRESVVRTVQANTTYRDGQLLLTENIARRLQSRVSGASKSSSVLYQPGDWILHLPHHHSRLEVLISLVRWL